MLKSSTFRPAIVRFAAIAAIASAVLVLVTMFLTEDGGRTLVGPGLGADFASVYMAGEIVASGDAHRLYDLDEQRRRYHKLRPNAADSSMLTYPLAPFLTALFVPLSLLPYAVAFGIWSVAGMFCFALAIDWHTRHALSSRRSDRALAVLVGVSFFPFLMECWVGGQSSWIAVATIVVAMRLDARGRPKSSGAVLAILLYKLTLVPILLLLLIVTGRYRHILGFVLAASALAGVSLAIVGTDGIVGYWNLLQSYAQERGAASGSFKPWKYCDSLSFLRLIFGDDSIWPKATYAIGVVAVVLWLAFVWKRRRRETRFAQLDWALALAWTPLLMPHFAIYDTAIVVPAAVLVFASCRESPGDNVRIQRLLAGGYLAAWITQPLAMWVGVQLYTLALLAFATAATRIAAGVHSDEAAT